MNTYDYIASKIHEMKTQYPSLRSRPDDYVFSALCVKAHFYKNPALVLNEEDFAEMIVDSPNDGGADILLSDPNSEGSDPVIGQSKFYKTISSEQVFNAMRKMADFYKDMTAGHYEQFNSQVQRQFLTLNAEVGEESLLRKPAVEYGKIRIDKAGNYLAYSDAAVIVNVSAFSIKELYETHNITLLSRNLRYHINGGKIDKEIRETIKNNPESFWLKNNGITIICDDFELDGCEVHLENFSIVNGGQTTYVLDKSKTQNDFWLSCKIIKTLGTTEKEKNAFSLEIAKAANAQKPIKDADLKANAPEQRSFAQAMRAIEVFYQTKRGEKIEFAGILRPDF